MFKFKQFAIAQDRCAMKICTDACILGAYAEIQSDDKVLDIGTGTGLLSLMLAQRGGRHLDAVELDPAAAAQAAENIAASPYHQKISLKEGNILEFEGDDYDLIISNPPFFSNQLQAPDTLKNQAKHTVTLEKAALATVIAQKLKITGRAIILLPPDEMHLLNLEMQKVGLWLWSTLAIRHHSGKAVFRHISVFKKSESAIKYSELSIYKPDNRTYSEEFTRLLKDYYIIF